MNERIIVCILYVAALLIIGFSFAFEFVFYGQTGDKKYSFLANFPFELNQFKRDNKKTWLLPILESVGSLCLIASMLFFAFVYTNQSPTSAYTLFAVATISVITFNILRFVKLVNFRAHMVFATINTLANLLLLLLYYFFFTNPNYGYALKLGERIALIIIILILILFVFFLMLNPSYKNWSKMVKFDNGNYSRPRYCYLAILEWGNLLVYLLSYIPIVIVMFF